MVTHAIASSRSSALNAVDGGWTGDLPLGVLLADDVMQFALRSAGLTAAALRLDFLAMACARRSVADGEIRMQVPETKKPELSATWRR